MALTNYRAYKWLIFLLADALDQKFGMTLDEINEAYHRDLVDIYNNSIDSRMARIREGLKHKEDNKPRNTNFDKDKYRYITYKTFLNWRAAIWKNFGIDIQHPVINGVARNSYIIENIEDLDVQKTLREMIVFLSEDEQRAYVDKNQFKSNRAGRPRKTQPDSNTSMGFFAMGNNDVDYDNPNFGYQYQEEPEMVSVIRFAMTMGEAIVIKYSKIIHKIGEPNDKKDKNFVLEPQELKCINGRWYVIGQLYEYGNRDTIKTAIYDVDRISLSEDEDIVGPRYELKEGFDLFSFISANDWTEWNSRFNPDSVVSMYLRVSGNIFEETPFCPTQIKIEDGAAYFVYQIYVKPDKDFFIQFMAYGDEVSLFHPYDKDDIPPLVISEDQYQYLNELRKKGL